MYPISYVRESADSIRAGLVARGRDPGEVDRLLSLDQERRAAGEESNRLRAERNRATERLSQAAKSATPPSDDDRARLVELRDRIRDLETKVSALDGELRERLLLLPQTPHASVPRGKDASDNVEVARYEPKRAAPNAPRPHFEVGHELNLLDEERGAKVAGEGFFVLWGDLARLEHALIRFMRELHRSRGYVEVSPPILVRTDSMVGTGQLPKFADDSYEVSPDGLWLIPTAEVPVTNLFRDEVLLAEDLPLRLVAYTPCFRREAGSHGVETRGIARVHQFDKVELVEFTTPESSYEALEELRNEAEEVLRRLDLPFRTMDLCTGDLGEKAAKCYDLELWAPGSKRWLEVSSISNFEAYQAVRANIRWRRHQSSKPEPLHTLNGSGVALPRLVIAILENYQTEDGRVEIPEAVRQEMGGQRFLEPNPFVGEKELGRGRHSRRSSKTAGRATEKP
ncbi:MAG TPA: serine--tRNA ligase [Thermoplasmata archaeon]|nr:serine--tRNA ligase [Thermoplasmata archaeon]